MAGFGVLIPAALVLVPIGIAILVYAYLKRGQGAVVRVPTLFLLRRLERAAPVRKKFIPPWRFFFELLLLLALLLGTAGLYRVEAGKSVAILVDNSFSMSAGGRFGPLLDAAREQARAAVSEQPSDSRVKVYTTSPALKPLSDDFETPSSAASRLREIKPAFAKDSLESEMERLAADPEIDRILVFTDRPRSSDSLRQAQDALFKITTVGADEKRDNIAVGAVSMEKVLEDRARRELKVSIDSYARNRAAVSLALEALSGGRFEEISKKELLLEPEGKKQVVFEVPPGKAFRVKLLPSPQSPGMNMLADDDIAYAAEEEQARLAVLVSEYSAEALGLTRISSVKFAQLSPGDFLSAIEQGALTPAGQNPIMLILHRVAVPKLPRFNCLAVLPASGIFSPAPPASGVQFARWNSAHPVLQYLNFAAHAPKVVTPLNGPAWMNGIITSTAGPAVLAGEKEGHRYVAVGFELFPYEGAASPFLSVFTLNAAKWLSDASLEARSYSTYAAIRVPAATEEALLVPQDAVVEQRDEISEKVLSSPVPGIIKTTAKDGKVDLWPVNFFDEQESDTLHLPSITEPRRPAARAPAETARTDYSRRLMRIVLLLLSFDLLTQVLTAFWRGGPARGA